MPIPSATGSIATYTSIQDPGSYDTAGTIDYGSNGSTFGPPEYSVANSSDDADGRKTWATTPPGDAFDSGWVGFTFDGVPGAQTTLNVTGSTTGAVSISTSFSSISSLVITAGVQTNAAMKFQSLVVRFYDASGNETSNLTGSDPQIDETDPSSDGVGEQDLSVAPAAGTSAVKVSITGQVRLIFPAGTYPGPNDLFGAIYIYS